MATLGVLVSMQMIMGVLLLLESAGLLLVVVVLAALALM
jgi:hypothetical protein